MCECKYMNTCADAAAILISYLCMYVCMHACMHLRRYVCMSAHTLSPSWLPDLSSSSSLSPRGCFRGLPLGRPVCVCVCVCVFVSVCVRACVCMWVVDTRCLYTWSGSGYVR